MKKIIKKEKIELIKKATKEINACIDVFNDDKLIRTPSIQELTMWQIEITRGVLAHSKKVSDVTCDLVDSYFFLTNIMLKNLLEEKKS